MPMPAMWRNVSLLAAGIILGAVVSYLIVCPEVDKWPEHTYSGSDKCSDLLREIVDKAFEDYNKTTTPAPTKDKIIEAIYLVLECAQQDLPGHTTTQKIDHAQAVRDAHTNANEDLASTPNKWDLVVTDLTVDVNHPH